jgi:thiol-disulfide isomerase/thioredoxin
VIRSLALYVALLLLFGIPACVSQGVFDEAQKRTRALEKRLADAEPILAQAKKREAIFKQLAQRITTLEAALTQARQRAGTQNFKPALLKTPKDSEALTWVRAGKVTSPTAKPRTSSIEQFAKDKKVVLLAYWATWCVPCTSPEELTHLRNLRKKIENAGLGFISMPIDDLAAVMNDDRADTWLYPLWHKDGGHIEMLPRTFIQSVGVNLPLFVLINDEATLLYFHNRQLDDHVVEELFTAALACR